MCLVIWKRRSAHPRDNRLIFFTAHINLSTFYGRIAMKAKFVVFSCALFVCVVAGTALADVQQWPGTKWFQPPEMVEPWGYDIVSQYDPTGVAPTQVVMDEIGRAHV